MPHEEFKVMTVKMLKEFRRRMDEHSENFNTELEDTKKNQTALKNTNTEIMK